VRVAAARPGEALLRDAAGTEWRLSWSDPPGRTFALPVGAYRWVTYRLVAGAWHLSATGELATLDVRPDAPTSLEARDGVRLRLRGAARPSGNVQAQVGVTGPAGGGLSIYRDGRRISLTCAIVDEGGGDLGQAPMRYG
jgi:hypothetical protein